MSGRREWSIHVLLFAMIAVATVPPIVIGLVQVRSASSVGRALLASQLDHELDDVAAAVRTRWGYRQGNLLLLASNEVTRAVLASSASPAPDDVAFLRELAARSDGIERAVVVGRPDVRVTLVGTDNGAGRNGEDVSSSQSGALPVTVRISDDHGTLLGELSASVALTHLLPAEMRRSASSPPLLAVFDSAGAHPLATPAVPADLLRGDTFEWSGQQWLVRRRRLVEPALSLVLTAPLDPFVQPFKRAATDRTLALVLGSVVALGLAAWLASRLSGSVQRLAIAADEIAQGNLGKRIVGNGTVEMGRLARSFNAMTSALEETLRQLAARASLAAVGEFAASLAHEIRNPLTAIRVDLQHLTRHAKPDVAERQALDRALRQVDRLDRTVSAALDLARGGNVRLTRVALDLVVRDAITAASPEAATRGAELTYVPADGAGLAVRADAGAIHQMLLNLLLNAVQALDEGGTVRVASARVDDRVVVTIADNGRGIPPDQLPRIFDPFYTTRAGGNGLGLAVARRIVISHGGEITIAGNEPRGTIATVSLRGANGESTRR